ncbi:ralA-binding protein 1 [Drosophila sechellia]|uniref:GM15058 n=1 Tax=Drosophila sechellia TaxID=7238 RepID=B4IKM8_DROSE|nr:ralA-binding protein 1 [Drosophila sechellia]EDW51632.1 GM15058 [Drosophila sechellia]
MDFDSPEEKEFPGLYASEAADAKSRKSKEESDFSEDHDHSKKDLLIGRRKDKKEKGKDRGYAALEGESSPEEELDTKSPSKSKKSKTFKFTSSKSKEKREKSRDKSEKDSKHTEEEPSVSHKVKEKERDKDKDRDEPKKKDKEEKRKEKDKKADKKDKKDKKSKQLSQQQDDASAAEEVLALGYPVFGVSVSLATERSRCHDGVDIPLVVRDCIDFLQDHLKCEQIYKIEPIKTRLMHFKRLYNNREHDSAVDELNLPTACSLLKLFLRELPEPLLTTDLVARFEEVASHPKVTTQQAELQQLLEQLPKCNRTLLAWVLLHFDAVIQQERHNKLNAQSLAMLLSPTLQMSHRLMVALLCHCNNLFADVQLIKYVPPLTSASPKLPDTPEDIQTELRKQDSLLSQIHSEMNAGFITKKREEQLWEVQRIITQLKRKLRTFEKKQEKTAEEVDNSSSAPPAVASEDTTDSKPAVTPAVSTNNSISQEEPKTDTLTPKDAPNDFTIDPSTGFILLPKSNPHRENLLRLQIEYDELMEWQNELKARIVAERNEVYRLKQLYEQQSINSQMASLASGSQAPPESDYERIIEHYTRENALLEHKKNMLGMELKEERRACIALQVELRLQQF